MVALSIMPLGNLIFGLFSNQIISFVFIITGAGIIISTLLIKVNDLEDISIENDKGIVINDCKIPNNNGFKFPKNNR